MGVLPSMKKFRVAGTVKSGLYEFDAAWAYLPLGRGAAPLRRGRPHARLVEVRIDDMYAVKAGRARDPRGARASGYITTDWIQMNQSLFSALWLEKIAIGITIGLIVDGGRAQHRGDARS